MLEEHSKKPGHRQFYSSSGDALLMLWTEQAEETLQTTISIQIYDSWIEGYREIFPLFL